MLESTRLALVVERRLHEALRRAVVVVARAESRGARRSSEFALKSRNTAGTVMLHDASSTISHGASLLHMKPSSTVHVLEQPSPLRRLPSSQASSSTMPSPQLDVHAPCVPGSPARRQFGAQPSKPIVLPSSQLSAPSTTPSPQVVAVHVLGEPDALQADLDLAARAAAVAGHHAAVVAALVRIEPRVAANVHFRAGHGRRAADVAGLDATAIRGAAVAGHRVAVVAGFAATRMPSPQTTVVTQGCPGVGTYVVGLDDARARAAVAGLRVAVVARLGRA